MGHPARLTKKMIEALPGAKSASFMVRDTGVRGLILSVNKNGTKTWKVQRDLYREGKLIKTVRTTIGEWHDLDVERARTRAQEIIARIKRGVDPNARSEEAPDSVLSWTLERLYREYEAHMRKQERRDVSIDDMQYRLDKYLADWKTRRIVTITKAECKARHNKITKDVAERTKWANGKRSANLVLKQLKWALNYAAKQCEDHETLPSNPVAAVTMHKERGSGRSLPLDDMQDWWAKVQGLPNPLRRQMHILGLLSGARPGTLVAIRREWINLDRQAIAIPPHTHEVGRDLRFAPIRLHVRYCTHSDQYRRCPVSGTRMALSDALEGRLEGDCHTGLEREDAAERYRPYPSPYLPYDC